MIYVFLDIEATCKVPEKTREIIRLSAVLWCDERQVVLAVFDMYIKPIYSKLNEYCTELTGITNDDLNNFGVSFNDAISKLDKLMYYYGVFRDGKYAFVTITDWDIGIMLPQQAKISRCKLPKYYKNKRKRIDLQMDFKNYEGFANVGLKNMLNYYGKEFDGTQHNSVDDCMNTLKLFKAIYCYE